MANRILINSSIKPLGMQGSDNFISEESGEFPPIPKIVGGFGIGGNHSRANSSLEFLR